MVQIEVFLNSIRLMNNIFYLLFIGIMATYMLLDHFRKEDKKVLKYFSVVLFTVFLTGMLLTFKFLYSEGEKVIINVIELAIVAVFIFYFVKFIIAFPEIKHKKLMKGLMIFIGVSSVLMIPFRILFGEILYSYIQFFLFIIDFWVVYMFMMLTLIYLGKKEKLIKSRI